MDMIIIQGNVNFLEKHVVEYLFKIGIGSGQSISLAGNVAVLDVVRSWF